MATRRKTNTDRWRGKRFIAYARCVSLSEAPDRLLEQLVRIRAFAFLHRMRCVGEVQVTGVSGRTPVLRDDLRALLDRKRQKDDFDVLVMVDVSRLTRADPDEAAALEDEFRKVGVEIVYLSTLAGVS